MDVSEEGAIGYSFFCTVTDLFISIPFCKTIFWLKEKRERETTMPDSKILFIIKLDLLATIYSFMEEIPANKPQKGKVWKLLLKIFISGICLWYVSGKIDFEKAGEALKNARWIFLVPALIAFIISKIISSIRLNIYFKDIRVLLSEKQNLRLYWLGMFYNLFLPGSIGGDAYKVILLTKRSGVPYKKTTAAVVLDRISGLLGLGLLLAVYSVVVVRNNIYTTAIISGALLAIFFLWFLIKSYFPDFLKSFLPTLVLGLFVQVCQVICAYFIMAALGIPVSNSAYIFIFLVSSVAAVLPLTIGGLGIREMVFLEGSAYFGLIEENSVVISILFYLITLFTSVWGLIYIFRDPFKKN